MHVDILTEQLAAFEKYYGRGRDVEYFFSPGRVNLIGEHLDYNGGSVLPGAISLGIYAIASSRNDTIVRLRSSNFPDEISFNINDKIEFDSKTQWGNFPRGIVKYFTQEGHTTQTGIDAYLYSNLPEGAGLSSSACIEILSAYMLFKHNIQDDKDRIRMAEICKKVENEFIGVQCGIMDQFAIAMGKARKAILLDTINLSYEYVPIQMNGYYLVIMNTNKQRKLTDSKYNERRNECNEALDILKSNQYNHLVSVPENDLGKIKNDTLIKRARHVITEQKRVLESAEALKSHDLQKFGDLMKRSHDSLRYDYEVTGTELDALVDASLHVEGCLGARMTGAGFGGCAIALINEDVLEEFKRFVGNKYKNDINLTADFYITTIDDGVKSISES